MTEHPTPIDVAVAFTRAWTSRDMAAAAQYVAALEAELAGVDIGRELRRYSLLQLWIFVPLSLVVLAVRSALGQRAHSSTSDANSAVRVVRGGACRPTGKPSVAAWISLEVNVMTTAKRVRLNWVIRSLCWQF